MQDFTPHLYVLCRLLISSVKMAIVTMYQSVSRTAVRLPGDGRRTAAATATKAARTNVAAGNLVDWPSLKAAVPLSHIILQYFLISIDFVSSFSLHQ